MTPRATSRSDHGADAPDGGAAAAPPRPDRRHAAVRFPGGRAQRGRRRARGVRPGPRRTARRDAPPGGRASRRPRPRSGSRRTPSPSAPTSLAPADPDAELGTGRLVLLHDPAGHEAWEGTFRVVTYVRAELDHDMAADPLLPGVGWAWLTEALDAHGAAFAAASGTVTRVVSESFGAISAEPVERPDRDPGLLDPAGRRVRRPPPRVVRPAVHHRGPPARSHRAS